MTLTLIAALDEDQAKRQLRGSTMVAKQDLVRLEQLLPHA